MNIRRLLLLTAYTALSLAGFQYCPPVGVLLLALLPCCVIAAFFRRPLSTFKIALFLVALFPFYFALSGPAHAMVGIVRRTSPSLHPVAWRVNAAVFPSSVFCNPAWIPSRRLIAYTSNWCKLVEDWHDPHLDEADRLNDWPT